MKVYFWGSKVCEITPWLILTQSDSTWWGPINRSNTKMGWEDNWLKSSCDDVISAVEDILNWWKKSVDCKEDYVER